MPHHELQVRQKPMNTILVQYLESELRVDVLVDLDDDGHRLVSMEDALLPYVAEGHVSFFVAVVHEHVGEAHDGLDVAFLAESIDAVEQMPDVLLA